MKRFRCLLLALLLSAGGLSSPVALAAYCSNVFPGNETPTGSTIGAVLDLSIMNTATYTGFPSNGEAYTTAGDHFYRDINKGNGPAYASVLSTKKVISVTPGQPVRIFVDGDLDLGSDSEINSNGYAGDLILIVRGNLSVGTKNLINALIYVTGNIISNPDTKIKGALTAQGTIDTGKQGVAVTYDPNAAQDFAFGDVCDPTTPAVVHHYQLSYASQALTCQAQTITVTACTDAACSTTYSGGTSSLTVTPGGSPISFVGSTTTMVAVRTEQTVSLAVSGASPSPTNPIQCRIDGGAASTNCSLTFADSGLLVQAPDLIAGNTDTLTVTAVRKSDNSAACVPAFANVTQPVSFWSIYVDPDAATQVGNRQVSVGTTPVASSSASSTGVNLDFDAQGTARIGLNYFDAGQMQLNAVYQGSSANGDAGLVMSGSDTFVSRPATLDIAATRPDGSTLDGSACLTGVTASGCGIWKAGDDFTLTISPLAADGSTVTPNFRLSGVALSGTLQAPSGGANGSLSPANYDHPLGGAYSLSVRQSEVGVFQLNAAALASYFGYDVMGQSAAVGRFTPAYLQASVSAQLTPACGTFSYQQQEIGFAVGQAPLLTVTGYNRQGAVTRNYDRGEFWRLSAPQRQDYLSITGRPSLDVGRLQTKGDAQSTALADASPGDGARQFRWADDRLLWTAAIQPQAEDLPFPSVAGTAIAQLRLHLEDLDGICYDSSGCRDLTYDFGGSEVRLGRLRFGNAFGSELQGLDVPFWLESWQDLGGGLNGFRREAGDSCSAPLLGSAALYPIPGAGVLQPGDFAAPTLLAPVAGQGAVRLPAPGQEGSVSVGLAGLQVVDPATLEVALPWLLFDWNGDGMREAARGLATFGIYRGSAPLIFRREIYR